MLASSPSLRYLLAFMMALWSPVCMCRGEANGASAEPVSVHGHGDHDESAESHGHDGCPGHDHKKSGCECPHLTATVTKAGQDLQGVTPRATLWVQWACPDSIQPATHSAGCERPFGTVPRPPTALLRLHCALIV